MNLLAAETVDSEAIQQVASNGGGIPLIAIVLVILALLVVLVILASILSSKKKAETRPVSQQDQKKQEKIKQEKEMKKQKHEEKQFMEKPSGLPEDNMIGKKAKRVKEPVVVKKPVVVKEQVEPVEPVAEEPVVEEPVKEPVKEPIEEPVEPVVDESRAEFDAINAIVIDGVCSARSYEPGDKITFKFNYGLATELNVAVLPELLSLTDKIANVRAEAYNGATIMVHADCLAPFAVKTLQAKPIVDKASVLSGKPKVTLKIYLEQVVR